MENKHTLNTNLKQYLLVKDSVPIGWAIVASAHAAVLALEKWRSHPDTQEWLPNFKKVVVKVTAKQFEKAKTYGKDCIAYADEEDYGPEEMVLVFRPSRDWNDFFKSLPLYK